jgi:putative transposase
MAPNHFKINYQYREYHFTQDQIRHASPKPPNTKVDILKIHNSDNILGLALAFYISFGLSARKTAYMLRSIYNIPMSYQTVLNYAQAAAFYAHRFNMLHKGNDIDDLLVTVADETYIKIVGEENYVWFAMSASNHSITSYHLSDSRETLQALSALTEAIRTVKPDQKITIVTDGLSSYIEAIQILNKDRQQNKIKHIRVIGLENRDDISEEYRHFKQMIERLNRTFKLHSKPAAGFNSFSGAMALITLFVTHYNFLRPHTSLGYKTPIHIEELDRLKTIQAKWIWLISVVL